MKMFNVNENMSLLTENTQVLLIIRKKSIDRYIANHSKLQNFKEKGKKLKTRIKSTDYLQRNNN